MCGIAGIFNYKTGRPAEPALLEAMVRAIHHRGPDWSGVWTDGEFGFGMARLSIIGGDEANQPLWTNENRTGIVFNGEIYNYQELGAAHDIRSTSDTRTLLELFARRGPDALPLLNGMFACAIFQKEKRELFLARDRMGQKPLFLVETADGIAFASELKPLLLLDNFAKDLDLRNLSLFLSSGYLPADRTPFRNISALPSAHWGLFGKHRPAGDFTRYWDLNEVAAGKEYEKDFREKFTRAVGLRLVSDVPIGVFLSGGMDSNAVLSTALDIRPGSIARAYTIAPTEGESEIDIVRKTCTHYGIPLEEVTLRPRDIVDNLDEIVSHADNLLANPPMFAQHALSAAAGGNIKVILTGGGGDELFYGYITWKADFIFRYWRFLPRPLRRLAGKIIERLPVSHAPHALAYALEKLASYPGRDIREAHAWWRTILVGDELQSLNPEFPSAWFDGYEHAYREIAPLFADFVRQTSLADLRVWWRCMGLYQADVVPMGRGVEIRTPFMDHLLVEWSAALPLDLVYHPLKSKPFLRKQFTGMIPEWVVKEKKRPFYIPLGQWLAGPLRDFTRETLYDSAIVAEGLLKKTGVEKLVEDHVALRKDNSFKLLSLLVLARWYETVYAARA